MSGAKQRVLLGALLLEAGQVLSIDALVEELWEDEPPPSAAHTLEANVSRLRRALDQIGVSVHRRGAGYMLDVGDASMDVEVFRQADRAAREALAEGPDDATIAHGRAALAWWRGPALGDVPLGPRGRAGAARLEEERLRLLELVLGAELALGRHAEVLPELQAAVGGHPFRERFVLQLMLALYRCGRHAEALAAYERIRAALDEQLGLQPSPELQRLSARIVRHDPTLDAPFRATERMLSADPLDRPRRRLPVALVVAGLLAATLAIGAGGSEALPEPVESTGRVALVLPRAPVDRSSDLMLRLQSEARKATVRTDDVELHLETIVLDAVAPEHAVLGRLADQLRSGAFELVVWIGDGAAAETLAPLVRALPATTFVYVDGSLDTIGLSGVPNVSAIRFANEEASDLTGFLTGLVVPIGASPTARVDTVGIVAGPPTRDTLRSVRGFRRGLERARPSVRVLVGHAPAGDDPLPCEKLANQQVDDGADVVVSLAGRCGLGALAVANARNVWGIGDDEGERMATRQRDRLLAHTYHDSENWVAFVIDSFVWGTLPQGKTRVLGLDDDYSVGLWFNDAIPPDVASRVIGRCSELREHSRLVPARLGEVTGFA